jgi:hypothetical protein
MLIFKGTLPMSQTLPNSFAMTKSDLFRHAKETLWPHGTESLHWKLLKKLSSLDFSESQPDVPDPQTSGFITLAQYEAEHGPSPVPYHLRKNSDNTPS